MSTRLPNELLALLELPDGERRLGAFELEHQLGRGGFAPVWLAREVYGGTELRKVAIKLFTRSAAAPTKLALSSDPIVEEARALCQVEHPNVVRFYQLVIDDERGVIGLVMEYVSGSALDKKLENGKLDVRAALDVGVAVAQALAAVHGAGLVHRDVKPANVIEAGGVYKLIDFGIAAAGHRKPSPEAKVTRVVLDDLPLEVVGTNMSMLIDEAGPSEGGAAASGASGSSGVSMLSSGTVGYMDPVSVATGAPATTASDLYSLGALLFECVTGKLPAVAAMAEGGGMKGEVLDGRAAAPPLATLDATVPPSLARVVDQLLRPARADRPASADEVLRELVRARAELDGAGTKPSPGAEPPPPPPAPEPPWLRRHARAVTASVVALIALGAAGGWYDHTRTRVRWFAGEVERRGVYEGVGEVPGPEGRSRTFRFTSRRGRVVEVDVVNGRGAPREESASNPVAASRYVYDEAGRVTRREECNLSGQVAFKYAFSWPREDTLQALRVDPGDVPLPYEGTDAAMIRYDLDARGYARRVAYFSDRGSPRPIIGAYGYEVTTDERGLEIEDVFLGPDGKPAPRRDGAARARFAYDASGNRTEASFLDASGRPVLNERGHAGQRMRYDERGNLVETTFVGLDDKPVLTKLGVAIQRSTYDAGGDEIERASLGPDGQPAVNKNGFALSRSRFDERGNEIERAHFGVRGEPVVMKLGFSIWRTRYDERGRDVERAYFGTDGAPMLNGTGYAVLRTAYDARGNQIERATFGVTGEPVLLKGRAVVRFRYDERDNQTEAAYFGAGGERVVAKDGCAVWRYGYDEQSHVTSRACFGTDERPLLGTDGCATTKLRYDQLGQRVEQSCLGVAGEPVLGREGWATLRSSFDDKGNEVAKAFFGPAGEPRANAEGYAIWRGKHDERGRVVEHAYLDAESKPVKQRGGFAARRVVYDERGNEIESKTLDEAGRPVLAKGYAATRSRFDDADQEVERAFFGVAGEPIADEEGCSSWRAKLDESGREVERSCLGGAGELALRKAGYAIVRTTYDDKGAVTGRRYLDVAGAEVPAPGAEPGGKATP